MSVFMIRLKSPKMPINKELVKLLLNITVELYAVIKKNEEAI